MDSNLLAVLFAICVAFLFSGMLFMLRHVSMKLSAQLLAIIGLYIFSFFMLDLSLQDIGFGNVSEGLLWGLGVSLVAIAALTLVSINMRVRSSFLDGRTKGVSKKHVAFRVLVDIPIGTVLFEELLFRGLIYGFFSSTIGVSEAIVISSALFGLWHVLPSITFSKQNHKAPAKIPTILGTVFFTALSGVVFALLREVSGSIIAPIALHYTINTASFLLSWKYSKKSV